MNVHFEKVGEYRKFIGQKLFEEALSLREGLRAILEIGPGTGDVLLALKSKGLLVDSEITFLEPNKVASDALRERFDSAVVTSNLEAAVKESLLPEKVDIVLANSSLHWVESLPEMILALREKMSKRSLIALSNTDVSRSFWTQIDRLVGQKFPGTSLFNIDQSHSMNREEWASLLQKSGFRVISGMDYHGTGSVLNRLSTH